ncbi:MAG: putative Ig domain-containing protein [Planctomycetaceae bacterium]
MSNGFSTSPYAGAVIGVDSQGNAYIADGTGGYTSATGGTASPSSTKTDYIDLAWDNSGSAWNLNILRQGGNSANSFTAAFTNILADHITDQLAIEVIPSIEGVTINNLTGVIESVMAGETVSFDIEFTGDTEAQSFDLLIVRKNNHNAVLASIPVQINTQYYYDLDAIDPDGDLLTYTLTGETHGATIDTETGLLIWEPPADGTYEFNALVTDGNGGKDTQTWTVIVGPAASENTAPEILEVVELTANPGEQFEYQVLAADADGDAITYQTFGVPPAGLTIDSHTGLVNWTPTIPGDYEFSVRVTDHRGGVDLETFSITVNELPPANHPPVITSTPHYSGVSNVLYRYDVQAVDYDFEPISYQLISGPAGMSIDEQTGFLSGTRRKLISVFIPLELKSSILKVGMVPSISN